MEIKIYGLASECSSLSGSQADISDVTAEAVDSYAMSILGLDPVYELEGESQVMAGGKKMSARSYRGAVNARSYPITFGNATYATELNSLMSVLGCKYHYIEFTDYGQDEVFVSNPATKAWACSITGFEVEHDYENGWKIISLNISSYRNA